MSEGVVDVVVLCTANRARSPLAEALLRRRLAGFPVRVRSRGTAGIESAPALPEMVEAARGLGVDLRGHRSHGLGRGELADAHLVLGFEPSHSAAAVVDGGADRSVVFTLPELVALLESGGRAGEGDVPAARVVAGLRSADSRRKANDPFRAPSVDDPLGRSRRTFTRVAREIDDAVERLVASLFADATSTLTDGGGA